MPLPAAVWMNLRSPRATLSSLVVSAFRVPVPGWAAGALRPPVAEVPAPPDVEGEVEGEADCASAAPKEKAAAMATAVSWRC
jgi:hypothetical protein